MTQRELARVLGVSSQAKISEMENDRRPVPPTVRRLLGLMVQFGGLIMNQPGDGSPRWYVCDRCAEMTSSEEAYMDDDGVYCETCGRTVRIAKEAGMEVPK